MIIASCSRDKIEFKRSFFLTVKESCFVDFYTFWVQYGILFEIDDLFLALPES